MVDASNKQGYGIAHSRGSVYPAGLRVSYSFKSVLQFIGTAVATAGCTALIGWLFDIAALKGVFPGLPPMKANAAFCFALAGISLRAFEYEGSRAKLRRFGRVCAITVFLTGLLTLCQYLFGWNFGIDQLLFEDNSTNTQTFAPGRMLPATAASFCLIGVALMLLNSERGYRTARILMIMPILFSLASLFDALPPSNTGFFSPIPPHTAAVLMLLCVGILFTHLDTDIVAIATSDSTGGIMLRRMLPIVLIVPLLLGGLRYAGEQAEIFNRGFGATLFMIVLGITIFGSLMLLNASALHRVDAERKRQEEMALKLGAIVECADEAIISITLDGMIISWNRGAEIMFGYSADEITGRPFSALAPPHLRNEMMEIIRKVKRGRHIRNHETKHASKSGRIMDVSLTAFSINDSSGQIIGVSAFVRDISEQKQMEQELGDSSWFNDQIIRNAQEGIIVLDRNLRYLLWNPFMEHLTGMTTHEVMGKNPQELLPMIGEHGAYSMFERALAGESMKGEDICFTPHRTGKSHWLSNAYAPLRSADGQIIGVIVTLREITGRKQAEVEIKKQAEKLMEQAQMIDLAPVIIRDLDNRIIFWNRGAEKLYGWSSEAALSQISHDFLQTQFQQPFQEVAAQLNREAVWEGELVRTKQDGKKIVVASHQILRKDANGNPVAILEVNNDITERKNLESQLRQAQKMEAIGRLAGGIAHDFNNLLTAIIGHCQLATFTLVEDDPMRRHMEEIEKAGHRAAGLTSQLLAFSRKQVLQTKVIDLNDTVAGIGKMLQRLIGEDIQLITNLDPALGRVKTDPGQIEQVIMNLAVNARDAMPRGGKLTIETDNVILDEHYASQHAEVHPGRYVLLAVSDNGIGMDKETQARIFEPFFTTKDIGKGTGLGLSTVFGIIKQSGGHVWFYSELEKGTTFKVYLPLIEEAVEVKRPQAPVIESVYGAESILLVEDDEMVRKLASLVLKKCGYTVLEAAGVFEAVQIHERHKGAIQLMVTDVVMPLISGPELARRLSLLRPDMKVLFMSGYSDDAIVNHGIIDGGTAFLQKPFTPDALSRKVRQLLDSR